MSSTKVSIMWDKFCEFLTITTLHGASYIGNKDHHTLRRCLWFIFICVAAGYFLKIQVDSINDYRSYRSVISESNHKARDGLAFPSITFCPKSTITNSSLSEYYQDVRGSLHTIWMTLITNDETGFISALPSLSQYNFYEVFGTGAVSLQDMFIQCRIGANVFNCSQYIEKTFWYKGLCYTFNSYLGRNEDLFLKEAGHEKGIQFILRTDPADYLFPNDYGVGIDVVVHDKAVYPLIEEMSWDIAPGTYVKAAMQQSISSVLPKPYSESDCIDDKTIRIHGYPYSEEACLANCYTKFLLDDCCDFYVVNSTANSACSLAEIFYCYARNYAEFADGKANCNCAPSCKKTHYSLDISTSKFPNKAAVEMAHFYNFSVQDEEEMQNSLVMVNFYFKTMKYNHKKQVASITGWQLFSSVGGILGLFLGASVLTIVEIIDFCLVSAIEAVKRQKAKSAKVRMFEKTDAKPK